MNTDALPHLPTILTRLQEDDPGARLALYELVYTRMRQIAGKMLNESFPRLRNYHDVTSVVHNAWIKLDQALANVNLSSERDFFQFVAFKIRQVLLDLAERASRKQREQPLAAGSSDDGATHAGDASEPFDLVAWTEFHERVSALPDDLRVVFEMEYYLGLPKVKIAAILQVDRRKVSELLTRARELLIDHLP